MIKREGRQGQNYWGGGRKWKGGAMVQCWGPEVEFSLFFWCFPSSHENGTKGIS